jgi:hypothetical protein
MGVENILAGDGIGIAVTGMIIVLVGLTFMSGYILLLPRLLEWTGRVGELRAPRVQAADAGVMDQESSLGIDPDLLAAIGYVIEAERERERSQDRQRITMARDTEQTWTAIGKMRTLSRRL